MLQGKMEKRLGGFRSRKITEAARQARALPVPLAGSVFRCHCWAQGKKIIPGGKKPLYFQPAPVLGTSKSKGIQQASPYQAAPGDSQHRALIQNGICWVEEPTLCFPPRKPLFLLKSA
jgi:hypothetical protein